MVTSPFYGDGVERDVAPNRVGRPGPELAVTRAIVRSARALMRPPAGHGLYVLQELDLGVGRPDVLIAAASPSRLLARHRAGLRLANLTEAEVLAASKRGVSSRHTLSHHQSVRKRLHAVGWPEDQDLALLPSVINDSLIIEAKVRDWRRGVIQLSRIRWAAHRAALAVPREANAAVARQQLRRNRIGLLLTDSTDAAWQVTAARRQLSFLADVWLSELIMRSLEGQRRSADRSDASARENDSKAVR
jgi:hypothetical protein